MNDRDWILRCLERSGTENVPYNFMFSPPSECLAREHYGENLEDALSLPIRMTGPGSIKPLYADPDVYGGTITDEFGVVWSTNRIDRGAPIGPCLEEADLSCYTFPDPAAEYRFEKIGPWCRAQEGHYRIVWVGDLWERATFMRGMAGLCTDVAVNPGFVEALLKNIADYIIETVRIVAESGDFECIAVSDDYGTQGGLLISPRHWRRLVKPQLERIYSAAKSRSLAVFHHSCGHIVPIIPDMIEIGLDILHPIQPEAMDFRFLKREFGRDVSFCGGVSTQGLLVTGTPEEVRTEVKRLKQEMGEGGGYILEPGITIQADVPKENLIALIDEARKPI